MIIVYVTLCAVAVILLLNLAYCSWRLGIGPMPSGSRARVEMIRLCLLRLDRLAQVDTPSVYHIGSGWGGLSFALRTALEGHPRLCERFKSISIISSERAWLPWICSLFVDRIFSVYRDRTALIVRTELLNVDGISMIEQLRRGDTILCYLCPEQMARIAETLNGQAKRGVILISLSFALPGRLPVESYQVEHFYRDPIYVYEL